MVPRQEGNRIETHKPALAAIWSSAKMFYELRAAAQTNYPCRM